MKKQAIVFSVILLVVSCWLLGKEYWEKPLAQWSAKDVTKMLNDSPWSRQMTLSTQSLDDKKGYAEDRSGPTITGPGQAPAGSGGLDPRGSTDSSRGYGSDKGSGVGGEKELYDRYTVRFFSAPMIRQAHVRQLQIARKYDSMTLQQKQDFDAQMAGLLGAGFVDQIVVSVEFATNNRQTAMEVDRQLKQLTREQLKQKVYLITDRLGRVEITEYHPPSADGMGARFVFPRTINGEQVLTVEDKQVRFELFVPGTGESTKSGSDHRVFVEWKVPKMLVNKQLVY
jgi:hypothetical protein